MSVDKIKGQVTETAECEICGKEVTYSYNPSESMWAGVDTQARAMTYHVETFHDAVVIRDGSRGIYLIPLFWEDAYDLLKRDLPEDVREVIQTFNASSVLSDDPMPTDEAMSDAMDMLCETTNLENDLSDAGYVVDREDGYVIWQVERPNVSRDGKG